MQDQIPAGGLPFSGVVRQSHHPNCRATQIFFQPIRLVRMSAIDRLRERINEKRSPAVLHQRHERVRTNEGKGGPLDDLMQGHQVQTPPPTTPIFSLQGRRPGLAGAPASDKPAYVSLAPLPKTPSILNEKSRSKTLKALKLSQSELILLCVPSSYTDATKACIRTSALDDGVREMLLLRSTGRIKVFDRFNNEISCEPYGSWLDAPWPGYWSLFRRASIEMVDADGTRLYCNAFSPAAAKSMAQPGSQLVNAELATFRQRTLQKAQPVDMAAIGHIYPSYATPGSSTKNEDIRSLVSEALSNPAAIDACVHFLHQSTLMSHNELLALIQSIPDCWEIPSVGAFLRLLHEPTSLEQALWLQHASRRLAVGGLVHASQTQSFREPHPDAPLNLDFSVLESLKAHLPMKLTRDQSSVVVAMMESMRTPTPMNALLCGDVGTGKTLAFSVPAAAAHLSGARVSIIAPTQILADQLAEKIQGFFPQTQVHRVYAGDKQMPSSAICVGTIGMTTVAQKCGYQPHLLIVDEQHKMAVAARRAMAGPFTHVLEASATPIPHALASTLYSGTKMLVLKQSPVARDVSSCIYDDRQRSEISKQIRDTIGSGGRVLIIYPRVSAAQDASVEQAAANLSAVLPGKVGYLHGKLSDSDVRQTLQSFRDGHIPLLVASTIVETGIDVPDIRLLVVRQADRFGIAQLHQLRGRLARNGGAAQFVMHVDDVAAIADETMVRLEAVANIKDGFLLAEEDMRQRGFGDLLGEQQNGGISLPMRLLSMSAAEVDAEVQALPFVIPIDDEEEGEALAAVAAVASAA